MEKPEVLTVGEAALMLRLSLSGTYAAVRDGTIPSVRIGRRILVPLAPIEKMLAGANGNPAKAA